MYWAPGSRRSASVTSTRLILSLRRGHDHDVAERFFSPARYSLPANTVVQVRLNTGVVSSSAGPWASRLAATSWLTSWPMAMW
ncbi:MAG: hypothetical protein ACREAA_15505 [Candidatus Polarisedimenticolia bacterium]